MKKHVKRNLVKLLGVTAAAAVLFSVGIMPKAEAQAPVIGSKLVTADAPGSHAKVYFTKHIDAEHLVKLYQKVNEGIYGKVAIKLHTGEKEGPNILPRDLVRGFQAQVPNSNIVETNTLYTGDRYTTEGHRETLKVNGWTFCPVDIMDEEGSVDLPVKRGLWLDHVSMGKNIINYDSMIVLTHFKGHSMGGIGGSLKNIAIGCASGQKGKVQVHGYTGPNHPPTREDWAKNMPLQDKFMELMADSGKATIDHFGKHIVFLNVMRRMSVDCDCAGKRAKEPTIPDIGMAASTDILAVDQACVDMVYDYSKKADLVERFESRHGLRQLTAMRDQKMGNDQYELICIDDD